MIAAAPRRAGNKFKNEATMKLYLYIMLLGWLLPSLAFAQSYAIDWYKIAGGGGTSTGAT